ncbi:D-glycerate dehydrogenase [Pelagibacteraceae bacterium]|nr:D-glycerate dehydrogenase [Pelagibacteraceae bacterium]|tara:strand:+ start:168 stop:1121 length:954 start_codon:yes stop_codon:yes gene_type:complete
MKKILITRKLLPESENYASRIFDAQLNKSDKLMTKEELINNSINCEGILSSLTEKLDADTISKLSNKIKIISNFAVGFGNIDIIAAKKRNIIVTNTPDVLTDATAEIAMLILLGAARRAKEGMNWASKKNWKWSADFLMGKQLTGARLGILGMGRIGRAVAEKARSFGMIIHYYNRSQLDNNLEKGAIYHKSLKSLLSVSDFFSINCPATKETKHIINKDTLNYFPNGAVVSNSARGDMIDDEAMVEALKKGKIYSLGLDVYNGEPNIHPEYLTLPNVFVLPHLGSATITTRTDMGNLAVSNLEEFFKTGKCKNTVN